MPPTIMKRIIYLFIPVVLFVAGCKKTANKDNVPDTQANLSFKITTQIRVHNNVTLRWSKATGNVVDTSLKYTINLNGVNVATIKDTSYVLHNILATLSYTGQVIATSKGVVTKVDFKIDAEKGFIYANSYATNNKNYDITCYSLTGDHVWSKTIGTSSFSVISNDTIFVQSLNYEKAEAYIYALNAKTGATLWSINDEVPQLGRSVLCHRGILYVVHDRKLFAYNPKNGQQLWKMDNNYQMPTIGDGVLLLLSVSLDQVASMIAYDAKTGFEKWRFSESNVQMGLPVISNGVVYFADAYPTGNFGSNLVGQLYSFDLNTGIKKWGYKYAGGLGYRPLVIGTTVFFSTNSANSAEINVYAVFINAGTPVWKTSIGSGHLVGNASGIFVVEGNVNFGRTVKLTLQNGVREWGTVIKGYNILTPEKIYATAPASYDGYETYTLRVHDVTTGAVNPTAMKFVGSAVVLINNIPYYSPESGMYSPQN